MKEELLKKLSRAARAKDNRQKVKEIISKEKEMGKVDYNDQELNSKLLEEMSQELKEYENEYIKLIEKMRDAKMKEEIKKSNVQLPESEKAREDEIEAAMADFVKEQEDLKIA